MLEAIADGATLEVPALWPLEVTNALLVLVRRRKLHEHDRLTALGWLGGEAARVHPTIHPQALETTRPQDLETSLPHYDRRMDLRYPTGTFTYDPDVTPEKRAQWISAIGSFAAELKAALAKLPAEKLDTPYRNGGWTARQVVHHVADSHINAYVRFRLALTEDEPTVKPYEESRWAELVDARTEDPAVSVGILEGVHRRWHGLLRSLGPDDFARTARHPQHGPITVDFLLQLYAWHGRHHIGHLDIVSGRRAGSGGPPETRGAAS